MGENGGNSQFEKEFNGAEELEDDKINVLLLGSDLDSNGTSRTDTIMIGQYDVEHERAKLVSIMRDTYVQIPGHGYNKSMPLSHLVVQNYSERPLNTTSALN